MLIERYSARNRITDTAPDVAGIPVISTPRPSGSDSANGTPGITSLPDGCGSGRVGTWARCDSTATRLCHTALGWPDFASGGVRPTLGQAANMEHLPQRGCVTRSTAESGVVPATDATPLG